MPLPAVHKAGRRKKPRVSGRRRRTPGPTQWVPDEPSYGRPRRVLYADARRAGRAEMTNSGMRKYKIAAIPGDGIGREVVPEGMRAIEAAGRRFGFSAAFETFDWSCEGFLKTGRMMPED